MDEQRRNPIPWIIIIGGLLLFLAGVALVMNNQPTNQVKTATPAAASQVQRVSLSDAKTAFDDGRAVFLDVRDSGSYAAGHIPGAVLLPIADLPTRVGELDPKAWIIPYCT
jgi:3-mercaptopyruvate sulfurtransferase SseA